MHLGPSTVIAVGLLGAVVTASQPARTADPTVGDCLSAAEASLKLRSEHKLRLSRMQLLVCSSRSCPAEVRSECMKRIDDVNVALPTIVLEVKDATGRELVSVKVTVDGQVVAEKLDGSALSLDPGAHEFTFEAAGAPALTKTIILHEGEKDRREMVTLGGGSASPPSTPASPPPKPMPEASPIAGTDSGAPREGGPQTQRTMGLIAGGTGLTGLALGTVFGALASSAWKTAQRECPSHTGCTAQAMNDRRAALTDATVSTIVFISGGAMLAGGLVLYLTAPPGGAPRVGLEARPGGLAIIGGF